MDYETWFCMDNAFIKQYLFVDIRDILCKWLHYNRKTYGLGFNQGQRMNVIAAKSSCMDAPDIWLWLESSTIDLQYWLVPFDHMVLLKIRDKVESFTPRNKSWIADICKSHHIEATWVYFLTGQVSSENSQCKIFRSGLYSLTTAIPVLNSDKFTVTLEVCLGLS